MKVLEAPAEAARALESLADGGESVRVLKAEVVGRLDRLARALEEARRRAAEIVEAAECEAEEIRRQAREDGRRDGYEEVLPLLGELRNRYSNIQDEAQRDTLDLAFRIARRIIGRQIEVEPEVVRRMICESLEHVRGKRSVVMHVNPADRPVLEASREALSRQVEGAPLHFEERDDIERGGCVIETQANRVDARLKTQLETLREVLEQ